MAELDQFESIFKSASKVLYTHGSARLARVLWVTDLSRDRAATGAQQIRESFRLRKEREPEVQTLAVDDYATAEELMGRIESSAPDLIVTFRHLKSTAKNYPFSLGALVDVMTQVATAPVLLLPHPDAEGRIAPGALSFDCAMVLTDHLTGSDVLVHWAVQLVSESGKLVLVHLEDDAVFQRYIATIAKVPAIDTDGAEREIRRQLLKEPADYIKSVEAQLADAEPRLALVSEVTMGRGVAHVTRLAARHGAGLIVMNTKDDEQLAMHGLAYPLAVEFTQTSLLLL